MTQALGHDFFLDVPAYTPRLPGATGAQGSLFRAQRSCQSLQGHWVLFQTPALGWDLI